MAESLQATLQRLERERVEADRRYNEALTALDRALPRPADLSQPPKPFDEHQLAALNDSWNIIPGPPAASGLRQKLAGFVWRVVAPYLQRQLTFNSQLVDHTNRSAAAHRETHLAAQRTLDALRERLAAQREFDSRLIVLLQQITAYVDTKDREVAGGGLVLNAAVSGLADTADKRWESLSARLEARTNAIAATQDTLRTMVGVSQQASMTLKREVERLLTSGVPATASSPLPTSRSAAPETDENVFGPALDAYKYVGFEEEFRGSREAIRVRLESYLPVFENATDVLDVGCGRGEFLELLGRAGVTARGIDVNHEMAELCRGRRLNVVEADAVSYLSSLADGSLGGMFASQVVEHLQPAYLVRLLDLAFHKLRPGGRIALETINPACWVAYFDSYIRDITHVRPLHPETLKYLVLASGFTKAEVQFRSPVPDHDRLRRAPVPSGDDPRLAGLADAFNENVDRLNARMFTHLDYAVVAERP